MSTSGGSPGTRKGSESTLNKSPTIVAPITSPNIPMPKMTYAIGAIVFNILVVLVLTCGVIAFKSSFGDDFFVLLAGCFALMFCAYPPTIATYQSLQGSTYSYENYLFQVFLPMCIGFLFLLSIIFFDLLKNMDEYYEQLVLFLGSASILSSVLTYTFIIFRIKYHGT
jgi:hypothetical protein